MATSQKEGEHVSIALEVSFGHYRKSSTDLVETFTTTEAPIEFFFPKLVPTLWIYGGIRTARIKRPTHSQPNIEVNDE